MVRTFSAKCYMKVIQELSPSRRPLFFKASDKLNVWKTDNSGSPPISQACSASTGRERTPNGKVLI